MGSWLRQSKRQPATCSVGRRVDRCASVLAVVAPPWAAVPPPGYFREERGPRKQPRGEMTSLRERWRASDSGDALGEIEVATEPKAPMRARASKARERLPGGDELQDALDGGPRRPIHLLTRQTICVFHLASALTERPKRRPSESLSIGFGATGSPGCRGRARATIHCRVMMLRKVNARRRVHHELLGVRNASSMVYKSGARRHGGWSV